MMIRREVRTCTFSVVEPNYFCKMKDFLAIFESQYLTGGVGGISLSPLSSGGFTGPLRPFGSPSEKGLGEAPPKKIFCKNYHVECCNFIVHLDHS